MPEHESRPSARTIWSGTISFGLVSIPVDLLTAVRARRTAMRMVDARGEPLGRQYRCPKDGEALELDDIVRGYETADGEMVVVTEEELQSVAPDKSRDIDLRRFVPLAQIPPAYYDRPYFLVPSNESTKAYHLLAATLERTERVGIGTFVMRGKEYLVAILSEDGLMRAETLRFADELRTPDDVGLPERPKVRKKRVDELVAAIGELKEGELDPSELVDEDAEALRGIAMVKEERGEDVVELATTGPEVGEGEDEGGVVDLMKLLKQRLAGRADIRTRDDGGQRAAERGRAKDTLKELSKDELYERAQALDIPGRSKMAKAELVKAIRAAS